MEKEKIMEEEKLNICEIKRKLTEDEEDFLDDVQKKVLRVTPCFSEEEEEEFAQAREM